MIPAYLAKKNNYKPGAARITTALKEAGFDTVNNQINVYFSRKDATRKCGIWLIVVNDNSPMCLGFNINEVLAGLKTGLPTNLGGIK